MLVNSGPSTGATAARRKRSPTQPWVIHAYAGNASQYAITVTAASADGTFTGGMGGTPGALDQTFNADSGPTTNQSTITATTPTGPPKSAAYGQQTTNFEGGTGFDQAAAVALDNGNILVAGTTADGQFGLVRYTRRSRRSPTTANSTPASAMAGW